MADTTPTQNNQQNSAPNPVSVPQKDKKRDVVGGLIDSVLGPLRNAFSKKKRTMRNEQRATNNEQGESVVDGAQEKEAAKSPEVSQDEKTKDIEEKEKIDDAKKKIAQKDAKKQGILDSFLPFLGGKKQGGKGTSDQKNKKSLADIVDLSDEDLKKLTPEEKKQIVDAEKIFNEGVASIRDLIAPSSFELNLSYLRIGDLYARSFYVFSYPRYIDTNWLSPVINMEVAMNMSQFIYPIDSEKIMKVLRRKVTQMSAAVHMNQQKGVISDPALDTALEDAEELRVRLQRGEEKFFQFALYFTIFSDDLKKLEKVSKKLESMLGGKLVMTKRADFQMEHAFNSTVPLCLDEIDVIRNMNTSPLSSTFPFTSSTLSSDEGILYGINRHNESLVIFDRFSLENANAVVFAKSGAGKSYAVKLEILRSLMMGTDVIIIDPENEYESLASVVGGSYLKVSLNADKRINPFDLPKGLKDEMIKPGDLLRANIISLMGLLKLMLGDISPEEEGILDKALLDVYEVKGMTMDKTTYDEDVPPTMEDLYDVLSGMDGAQQLLHRLEKYTKGSFSGIFNKPTNIDLNAGLMVFSIRDLEDSLRPIAMYIILNYIWNRVRSSFKKRLLIIDEAWSMMQHEDSAKFLYGLVKRARKYWLGVTTITQDVEDFMKSSYGKPIITNSSMQLLLKQAPSAIEMLSKAFNLTEGEKYMLLNSSIGQGLFFAGQSHVAIQIIASYTEDKIVTTNPEELAQAAAESADFETQAELPETEAIATEEASQEAPTEEPSEPVAGVASAEDAETPKAEESPVEPIKEAQEPSNEAAPTAENQPKENVEAQTPEENFSTEAALPSEQDVEQVEAEFSDQAATKSDTSSDKPVENVVAENTAEEVPAPSEEKPKTENVQEEVAKEEAEDKPSEEGQNTSPPKIDAA